MAQSVDLFLMQNPRRGTRRFGGSTQAAARARRAPAPAAPAPAAAPKKARATKPRTRKTVAGNSLFFKLLNAVPIRKNALIPEDIHSWGTVRVDDVQRFGMTDGISYVFLDSLEGDTKDAFKKYIERKSNRSRSQYNIEKGLFFITDAIKSKVEITNDNISRGRINGAFVERKRLKPTSSYRSGIIEFLFPPGVIDEHYQGFDLTRTKFLVKLTKANRIVVGYSGNTTNAPVLLYRDNLLVAFFNGTTGGESAFRNGDYVNDVLDQLNIKRNPRRGSRRFGGSTQAAARARRAPAPAAPAPAAAPKKTRAAKSKTTKATKTDGLLFSLLQAAPIRKDWLSKYYIGPAEFNNVTETIISDGDILIFKDALSLADQKKYSKIKETDLRQYAGAVFSNFKDPIQITDEMILKSRILGAFVTGKRLKNLFGRTKDPIYIALPSKRSGESHRGIELTTLKRLVTLTKADKVVFGSNGVMPVVLYRGGSIVAAMTSPFLRPSDFQQGDQVNDILDQLNVKRNPRRGRSAEERLAKRQNPRRGRRLNLYKDGIEGHELSYKMIPGADAIDASGKRLQYALGFTQAHGIGVYSRRAMNRGLFGGWRWEMDPSKLLKQNPTHDVKAIYQKFNGRPSRRSRNVAAPAGTPRNLAQLGRLRTIKTIDGRTWRFPGNRAPFLAADSRGRLHVVGGQYRANPAGEDCGEIDLIEYQTKKPHLGHHRETIYYHKLGEETGERPTLEITPAGELVIHGGAYRIETEGIVN